VHELDYYYFYVYALGYRLIIIGRPIETSFVTGFYRVYTEV